MECTLARGFVSAVDSNWLQDQQSRGFLESVNSLATCVLRPVPIQFLHSYIRPARLPESSTCECLEDVQSLLPLTSSELPGTTLPGIQLWIHDKRAQTLLHQQGSTRTLLSSK